MTPTAKKAIFATVLVAWVAGVGFGFHRLWTSATAPGAHAQAPAGWPAASALVRPAGHGTLVVFLHARCPCSNATVAELARVLASCVKPFTAYVLVLHPPQQDVATVTYYDVLRRQPGVQVIVDDSGREAEAFNARTSGEALFYDASGALRFQGGLTAARGHEGGAAGQRALAALLSGEEATCRAAPVFGCPLFELPQS